jgi:flagellar basal body rod protein FlgG
MNRGLYTVTSGGLAALARLDAVSQNLANVGTAGFKAERLLFQVRPLTRPLDAASPGALDPVLGRTAAQVVQTESIRDFSQGPIRVSGNPLDVAITGDGFFAVTTPRGERYTRQGSFTLDPEGYLVTQAGERVQGDGGDLRVGTGGDVVIGEDGTVVVDGSTDGRLKLVQLGDPPKLVPEGASLFAPLPGTAPVPLDATATHLQPGAIEAANVDAVAGLVELVDVSRAFESYMRALQRLDEITQRSINDVGRV